MALNGWNGKELVHEFTIDFLEEKLGLPHIMRFGDRALYADGVGPTTDTTVADVER